MRTRFEVTWERSWPGRSFGTVARVGYEHVSNFGFEAGLGRDHGLLEIRGVLWLSKRTGQERRVP
ncbi:MAG: hypothetical protein IH968_11175 [Gemmatimonadetes bacterium]|nr:hypothetical protein [Gemmatimonadota bacterium]